MSHTPGPWKTEVGFVGAKRELFVKRTSGDGLRVAHDDDARLIAAAPDLLAAAKLQDLNFERKNPPGSGYDLYDDDHEAWTALRNAIAKAEGAE